MAMANLYAWNPHLESRRPDHRVLALLLSPFAGTDDIALDRALCDEILARLQIERQPVSWHAQPMRTSYFSRRDTTGPDHWRVAWSMTIELDHGIEEVPALQHEFFELSSGGAYVPGERALDPSTPYWVICDFEDQAGARAAASAICQRQSTATATVLNLNDQFLQLQIDLGIVAAAGFAAPEHWALAAEQICRDHGGIPNNEEREEEWDVVFNEHGIAFDEE